MARKRKTNDTPPAVGFVSLKDFLREGKDRLPLDHKIHVRQKLDQLRVRMFKSILGDTPPVVLYRVDGLLYLIDGYHRVEAAKEMGETEIRAAVLDNKTEADALYDSGRVNAKHGQPLNPTEKQKAIHNMLEAHPEYTINRIAQHAGVQHGVVQRERAKLIAEGRIPELDKGVTADGRIVPRERYADYEEIASAIEADPDASNREIAQRVGVSDHKKVGRVRQQLEPADGASREARTAPLNVIGEHRIRKWRLEWLSNYAPAYDEGLLNGCLIRGDCIEEMAKMAPKSIDAIITDPPYGVGKDGGAGWDPRKDDPDALRRITYAWVRAGLPLLKPSGRFASFFSTYWDHVLREVVEEVSKELGLGLVFQNRLVWEHSDTQRREYSKKDLKFDYDPILVWRGPEADDIYDVLPWKKNKRRGSIWFSPRDFGLLHIAEKPLDIVEDLVRILTDEEQEVLDPFVGSGTTAIAAERLNRQWIGIDLFSGDRFDDGDTQMQYTQRRIMLEGHLHKGWKGQWDAEQARKRRGEPPLPSFAQDVQDLSSAEGSEQWLKDREAFAELRRRHSRKKDSKGKGAASTKKRRSGP